MREERHDYNNDPYFYTAPVYRYHRGGSYYEINQYGADLLRQAVNNGYQEGFRAGVADREDNWRGNYQRQLRLSGRELRLQRLLRGPGRLQYYFREGFQRGYEDGYNDQYQYGYVFEWLIRRAWATVLSAILNLQAIR